MSAGFFCPKGLGGLRGVFPQKTPLTSSSFSYPEKQTGKFVEGGGNLCRSVENEKNAKKVLTNGGGYGILHKV